MIDLALGFFDQFNLRRKLLSGQEWAELVSEIELNNAVWMSAKSAPRQIAQFDLVRRDAKTIRLYDWLCICWRLPLG